MKNVYSLSGGQDSSAMTVRALELGYPVDYIVFIDTGNEFPSMYDYIDKLDLWLFSTYGIKITRLKSKNTLESLVFSPFTRGKRKGQIRGFPYSSMMSFCTRDLKKNVSNKFCKSVGGAFLHLGYVARERSRVHQPIEKYIINKFPLMDWGWNEAEVSKYLKERTLFNELYNDFSRTGCMFCPKQSKDSWFVLYSKFPDQWAIAKDWELRALEKNSHIQTFRQSGPLFELEIEFKSKKISYDRQTLIDWNEQDVSCMCK